MISTKISKLPESLIEIEGQIEWPDFQIHRAEAIKNLGKDLELPGFRKGHVPENILLKNISEIRILEEMAELAMPKAYLDILEEHKIDAIGRPEISITKLARDNPLGFKIKTAVLPIIALPDYKSLAGSENKNKVEKIEVGAEEVQKAIEQLQKMRTPKDGTAPELNDEFVKTLGNFQNVDDFKTKLTENIRLEKEFKEKEKHRIKIIEGVLAKTDIELPRILVESEQGKMMHQLKGDIENSGFKFDDYLVHLKKTEAEMRKDWEKEAEKRAKLELVLREIGKSEGIKADQVDIEAEAKKVLDMYKGADPVRARDYVENLLKNEKIFQFLENQ